MAEFLSCMLMLTECFNANPNAVVLSGLNSQGVHPAGKNRVGAPLHSLNADDFVPQDFCVMVL